jgi:transcriptional regulator with XRE-family HTH domain
VTDIWTARGIGARVRAARKLRGMKSQSDLANAIAHESVTAAVIQNLEAGRKSELTVSQLLNIAFALRVPPSFLLSPLGNHQRAQDLPSLVSGLDSMSSAEFDAWFSGLSDGGHRFGSPEEQVALSQLEAIRELTRAERDLRALRVKQEQSSKQDADAREIATAQRESARAHVARLRAYLATSGYSTESIRESNE